MRKRVLGPTVARVVGHFGGEMLPEPQVLALDPCGKKNALGNRIKNLPPLGQSASHNTLASPLALADLAATKCCGKVSEKTAGACQRNTNLIILYETYPAPRSVCSVCGVRMHKGHLYYTIA